MSRRRAAAAATITALALAGLAGCGGGETVTQTVTTDELPVTTAPGTVTTAPAPPTTTVAPTASVGQERLPPEGSLPATGPGNVRPLDGAQEFVDALYQTGDPAKPAAQARLEAAGYSAGILRDETGTDPANGIALFRTYAIAVRDETAAQTEVDDAADEVERSSAAPSTPVDIPEIPGARALRLDLTGGNGSVVLVTFAAGPYVYGLQGVSQRAETLPQDGIVAAARDLYARVSTTP